MEQDQEKDVPATEGDDAEGHRRSFKVEDAAAEAAADDAAAEDTEGHRRSFKVEDAAAAAAAAAAEDAEGHRITKK